MLSAPASRRGSFVPDWAASSYTLAFPAGRTYLPPETTTPQLLASQRRPSVAERDLAGVRAKLIDYLRAEAVRLLIEQAEARSSAVSSVVPLTTGQDNQAAPVHAPVPVRIALAPSAAEIDIGRTSLSAPRVLERAMLRPVAPMHSELLGRRPSAPNVLDRRMSAAAVSTRYSGESRSPPDNDSQRASSRASSSCTTLSSIPLSSLLARARANVAADLRAQNATGAAHGGPACNGDRSWMAVEVGCAYVRLDEGFRRWTEEVTARALAVRSN